jgi:hypothetical protein
MIENEHIGDKLEPSTAIMIAEHERLAGLYLFNSEMGEKRTSLYLSVVSLGAAGLIALAQILNKEVLTWPVLVLVIGMFGLGLLTFQRLIERRIRIVEDLRAINRIHRYFVDKEPNLELYFYWPPSDDVPSFHGKNSSITGLRDIVAFLNSFFGGIVAGELLSILLHTENRLIIALSAGFGLGVILWFMHQVVENLSLEHAERNAAMEDVRFPSKNPALVE